MWPIHHGAMQVEMCLNVRRGDRDSRIYYPAENTRRRKARGAVSLCMGHIMREGRAPVNSVSSNATDCCNAITCWYQRFFELVMYERFPWRLVRFQTNLHIYVVWIKALTVSKQPSNISTVGFTTFNRNTWRYSSVLIRHRVSASSHL